MTQEAKIEDLLGKVLTNIEVSPDEDEIVFTLQNGNKYMMYHQQDCCEHVRVEDICGDLDDLIGTKILLAEEVTNSEDGLGVASEYCDFLWTFYKLRTIKGSVTIRWLGESDCYSISVELKKIN